MDLPKLRKLQVEHCESVGKMVSEDCNSWFVEDGGLNY